MISIDRIIPIPRLNAVPEASPKSMYLFSCFHTVVLDEMAKQKAIFKFNSSLFCNICMQFKYYFDDLQPNAGHTLSIKTFDLQSKSIGCSIDTDTVGLVFK